MTIETLERRCLALKKVEGAQWDAYQIASKQLGVAFPAGVPVPANLSEEAQVEVKKMEALRAIWLKNYTKLKSMEKELNDRKKAELTELERINL